MRIENKIFWFLNVICILLIIQIGLGIIPLFYSIFSNEFAFKLNQVLLNLSYSYIAGVIMYLLISYLPDLQKKRRINSIIKSDLELLVKELNIFIFYINKQYVNVKDIKNIKITDFQKFRKFSMDKMN